MLSLIVAVRGSMARGDGQVLSTTHGNEYGSAISTCLCLVRLLQPQKEIFQAEGLCDVGDW